MHKPSDDNFRQLWREFRKVTFDPIQLLGSARMSSNLIVVVWIVKKRRKQRSRVCWLDHNVYLCPPDLFGSSTAHRGASSLTRVPSFYHTIDCYTCEALRLHTLFPCCYSFFYRGSLAQLCHTRLERVKTMTFPYSARTISSVGYWRIYYNNPLVRATPTSSPAA
jgi:hypothetical protein